MRLKGIKVYRPLQIVSPVSGRQTGVEDHEDVASEQTDMSIVCTNGLASDMKSGQDKN
jgi:hypothetical protein